MNRIEKVRLIDDCLCLINTTLGKIFRLAEKETNKTLRIALADYIYSASLLNYNLATYLAEKLPEYLKQDKIDKEFYKLMKKAFKKKDK